MANDEVFEELKDLIRAEGLRDRNEAETRHKIIDFVLHRVLTWPRNRVEVEEYIRPGYADYVLKKPNGDPIILIEAKREGDFFTVPRAYDSAETYTYIGLEELLTDDSIREAITQVRRYCVDVGCEYAAITNGHEWIFFKTFERSRRWDTMRGLVLRRLGFFEAEYTKAVNGLSFTSITEQSSLSSLLTSNPPKDRLIFYPRERVASYSHPVTANRLAPYLRPIVQQYYGVISDDDPEFMNRCYVSQRDYDSTLTGMRSLIQDALTPYLRSFGVKQLSETEEGGQIGEKITKAIKRNQRGQVLVLFGGKGAGKSTFIKRLLHHQTPQWLRTHSVVVILDLLKVPEDAAIIRETLWSKLVEELDTLELLKSPRDELIRALFRDRFQVAERQELAGLNSDSEAYNTRLNSLVAEWKMDKPYCAQKLVRDWQQKGRGIVVVLDNTDQYSGAVQDFCFTSSQGIADQLGCTSLISMREERFFNSKVHGVLDAFQNSGFHISSPRPSDVFKRRLAYTIDLLSEPDADDRPINVDDDTARECIRYLSIVKQELDKENSHLTSFLSACAHGDTRLSLDLFRSFLLSGYTNVDEIISSARWDFQIHQVIKPVMVPTRYFYDEATSDIPNIFQLRFSRNCSHFTSLRILRKLAKVVEGSLAGYVTVAQLQTYFVETFNMLEDMQRNLDVLLKHGFVEASNRIDYFSEDVDSVKITPYGVYMLKELAYYFTYLDLVCMDCAVFDEEVSNYLSEAARREYELFIRRDRLMRVEVRLDRVERFIDYLGAEEARERDTFSLTMPEEEMFTFCARQAFDVEKAKVLASARRPKNRR
jgi:hypothetical protein